jgi:signal transduction histidine kinase
VKSLGHRTIGTSRDIVVVRQQAKQIAELLGLAPQDQTRMATAVSEIAREILASGCSGSVAFELDAQAVPLLIARVRASPGATFGIRSTLKPTRLPAANSEALIAARRLVDHFAYSEDESGVLIDIGKRTGPKAQLPLTQDFERALREQAQIIADDPSAAFDAQTKELVASLQEVQDKQLELQRLNEELQDTNRGVVALYAELEEKAEQLRAASEAKSRFLANVSHEFRTPLNSILALSRLLLDRVDGDLQVEQEKQVAFIRRSAETLLEFVNDLLDLAKVEAGKIDVHPSEFSLSEFLRGLRGVLKPLKPNDVVELIFEECAPISIVTDEGKLGQILRNFISNAIKYTERGEVRVRVEIVPERGVAMFEVSDTGIGIAPEDQARIFEEFEQVSGVHQLKNKGSGLGLALSHRLAKLLKGEITLESAVGRGSTFRLCIPLDYEHPGDAVVCSAPAKSSSHKRVLVVDDEETFRYIVRHIVASELGFELIEAKDGAEGLLRARRDHPDVLVLDLQMPVMTGQQVLGELAADPHTRDIPVLVSTSLPITPKLQEELPHAYAVLSKSDLSKDTLLDCLKRALAAPVRSKNEALG